MDKRLVLLLILVIIYMVSSIWLVASFMSDESIAIPLFVSAAVWLLYSLILKKFEE